MGFQVCDHEHIRDLGEEIIQTSITAGWVPEDRVERRTFGDLIALLHSEASEALEEYRNGHDFAEIYYNEAPDARCYTEADGSCSSSQPCMHTGWLPKPEGIPTELADIAIRLFYTASIYGIDLESAIRQKIEYNKTRGGRYKNDGAHIVGADGKRL